MPSAAIAHSVVFGAQIETRSPGSMPEAISARAARRRCVSQLAVGQARPLVDERLTITEPLAARASTPGIVCGRSGSVTSVPLIPKRSQRPSKSGARRSLRALAVLLEVGRPARQLDRERLVGEVALEVDGQAALHEQLGEPDRDGRGTRRARSTSASATSRRPTFGGTARCTMPPVGGFEPGDLAAEHQQLLGPGHARPAAGSATTRRSRAVKPMPVNGARRRASSATTAKSDASTRLRPEADRRSPSPR